MLRYIKKELIRQQLEAAQAKFDAGLATIVDVNTTQAALNLTNSQEIAAQADLIVKRGVLEQLVGRPVGPLKPLIKEARIDGVLKTLVLRQKIQRATQLLTA